MRVDKSRTIPMLVDIIERIVNMSTVDEAVYKIDEAFNALLPFDLETEYFSMVGIYLPLFICYNCQVQYGFNSD